MTINDEKYYGAESCSTGPQSGATGTMSYYLEAFEEKGVSSLGIYNCRDSSGGSGFSVHSEGRAMDFGVPGVEQWGKDFAEFLVAQSKELGVMLVIFDSKIWGSGHHDEGWRPYGGVSPHTDHLHVELNWETAKLPADEVKQLWTDIAAGKGRDSASEDTKDDSKTSDSGGDSPAAGIVDEEDLTGMTSFKERQELERRLEDSGVKIEDADRDKMSNEELRSLADLEDGITGSKKTTTDYLSTGVSVVGYVGMIYSITLFFAYLFDTTNNFTEGSAVKAMTGGKLEPVHDKEDAGKHGGVTKITLGGAFKYALIGMLVSLFIISGTAFGWAEALILFIQNKVNG